MVLDRLDDRDLADQWQPDPISTNPGAYPLSEPESRAVVDFISTLTNLTGSINYHMSGNVAVFPPSNQHVDPITGDKVRQPYEDELVYKRLGAKIVELDTVAKVQVFRVHGNVTGTAPESRGSEHHACRSADGRGHGRAGDAQFRERTDAKDE